MDSTVNDTKAWILVNIRQVGYFRVLYDDDTWHALIGQLNEDHAVSASYSQSCRYNTHTHTHTCMHVRTHAHTLTYTYEYI